MSNIFSTRVMSSCAGAYSWSRMANTARCRECSALFSRRDPSGLDGDASTGFPIDAELTTEELHDTHAGDALLQKRVDAGETCTNLAIGCANLSLKQM